MPITPWLKVSFLTLATLSSGALAQELTSVGVTVGDLANPFFVQMGEAVESKARELGGDNVQVTLVSAGYDLNVQTGQIDNFIASNVDMIILNAVDFEGIAPAVRRAKEAGIVVIAVDVGAQGGVDATVTSNNVQAGEQACQYIVDRLGGEGNVIIVNGPPVTSIMDRVNGCKSVLEQNPGITVLSDNQNAGGSRDGGFTVMSNLLTSFPDINAVFAINDPTGIGVDLAARQAQRTDFFIAGVDGAPDAEVALADENSLFAATPAQDPYTMAARGVEVGYEILQGNPPEETTILIPTELITRENLADYQGWTAE